MGHSFAVGIFQFTERKFVVTATVLVIVLPTIAALVIINLLVWLCIWRRMRRPQAGATQPCKALQTSQTSHLERNRLDYPLGLAN